MAVNLMTVIMIMVVREPHKQAAKRSRQENNKQHFSFFKKKFLTLQHSLLLEDFFYDLFSSVYKFALSLLKVLLLILTIKNKKNEGKS